MSKNANEPDIEIRGHLIRLLENMPQDDEDLIELIGGSPERKVKAEKPEKPEKVDSFKKLESFKDLIKAKLSNIKGESQKEQFFKQCLKTIGQIINQEFEKKSTELETKFERERKDLERKNLENRDLGLKELKKKKDQETKALEKEELLRDMYFGYIMSFIAIELHLQKIMQFWVLKARLEELYEFDNAYYKRLKDESEKFEREFLRIRELESRFAGLATEFVGETTLSPKAKELAEKVVKDIHKANEEFMKTLNFDNDEDKEKFQKIHHPERMHKIVNPIASIVTKLEEILHKDFTMDPESLDKELKEVAEEMEKLDGTLGEELTNMVVDTHDLLRTSKREHHLHNYHQHIHENIGGKISLDMLKPLFDKEEKRRRETLGKNEETYEEESTLSQQKPVAAKPTAARLEAGKEVKPLQDLLVPMREDDIYQRGRADAVDKTTNGIPKKMPSFRIFKQQPSLRNIRGAKQPTTIHKNIISSLQDLVHNIEHHKKRENIIRIKGREVPLSTPVTEFGIDPEQYKQSVQELVAARKQEAEIEVPPPPPPTEEADEQEPPNLRAHRFAMMKRVGSWREKIKPGPSEGTEREEEEKTEEKLVSEEPQRTALPRKSVLVPHFDANRDLRKQREKLRRQDSRKERMHGADEGNKEPDKSDKPDTDTPKREI